MKKILITILIVAGAVGGVYVYQNRNQDVGTPNLSDNQVAEQANSPVVTADYVKYQGQDGKNAFQVLQSVTQVEYKQYSFGVFVESVGGVKPDKDHFWKLYVNGQESQVGAGEVQTKNSDVIEWKLEEVKSY